MAGFGDVTQLQPSQPTAPNPNAQPFGGGGAFRWSGAREAEMVAHEAWFRAMDDKLSEARYEWHRQRDELAGVLADRYDDYMREYARCAKVDDTQLQAFWNGKAEAVAGARLLVLDLI